MIKKLLIIGFAAVLILSLCGITNAAININLPIDPVTLRVQRTGSTYFKSQLKNVPPGYDVTNGTYNGWCAHKVNKIYENQDYVNTYLYSSYNGSLPGHLEHQNWSKVNYIINYKALGATWSQVQDAIWYILDFRTNLDDKERSMVENASDYVGTYNTTYFDLTAIIADAGVNVQRHFIEKRFIDPKVTNLVVMDVHNGNLSLSWDPSATNSYLSHYEIFRDNVLINTTSSTCFLDTGLQIGQLYTYKVRAVDVDGNKGLYSDPVSNKSTDTLGPSKVNNLKVDDAYNGNLSLSWSAAFDNSGFIHHYEIFRDDKSIANVSALSYLDSGLLLNVLYTYKVRAWDASSNFGPFSDPDSNMSTYLDDKDPSKVLNLTVKDVHNGNLSLSWSAAFDNSGFIHHYEIFRDDVFLNTSTSTSYLDTGLVIGQLYTYKVRAWDAANNSGPFSDEVSNISTDTLGPSKVNNLKVDDAYNGNLSLSWSAAFDNSGFIHHYEIFRDDKSIANVSALSYLDSGLLLNVLYTYKVRAWDASSNFGPFSDPDSNMSTYLDDKDPSKVLNLTVKDVHNGNLSLSWSAAFDNSGFIHHYEIFRDDVFLNTSTSTSYLDTGLVIGQLYTYKVRAWDAANNSGPFSDNVSNISTDTLPPSKVKNLQVFDALNGKLQLTWNAAKDNVGVHHYEIFRDNKSIDNTTSLNYLDKNLTNGVLYKYNVRAIDAAGNIGELSDDSYGLPSGCDEKPPSKVENLTVTDAFNGKLQLRWSPAKDNVGVHHYEIFRDNKSIGNTSSLEYLDKNLVNGQLYTYKVRAWDASSNFGPFSDPASGKPTKKSKPNPPSPPNNPKGSSTGSGLKNIPPVADASAGEPYSGFVNENIVFNGSKSYDPDQYIKSYHWDFGDGTSADGKIVNYKYSCPGNYIVKLTVFDTKGASDVNLTNALIHVRNYAPTNPNITGPTEGYINVNYNFTFYSQDDNSDNIKYVIKWGDGSMSESGYMPSGQLFNLSHKWIKPGNYMITVTANDSKDNSTTEFEITIYDIEIPEENNFILIIFALLALMFLLFFLLLAKRDKDDEEEQQN